MEFYNSLRELIKETLEDLDVEEVEKIVDILRTSGVKKREHLKYLETNDLVDVLNKIESRILIDTFKSYIENDSDKKKNLLETFTNESNSDINGIPSSSKEKTHELVAISWQKMPAQLLQNLNQGKEPLPNHYRDMIRIIADDIFFTNATPSKKMVNSVAEICVQKFSILKDKVNEITVGSGYDTLAYRLYTRIENFKRKKCTDNAIEENVEGQQGPSKRKKTLDSYGCVAWEISLPVNETINSLEEKKFALQNFDKTDKSKCLALMTDTYYLQRKNINNGQPILTLLREWPYLFKTDGLLSHFETLTSVNIMGKLEKTIEDKGKNLVSFLTCCEKIEIKSFIVKNKNENILLLILFGFAKYFKEEPSALIKMSEVLNPHDVDQVNVPSHPCLVGKGTCELKTEEFLLTIDGVVVNSDLNEPSIALAVLFAAYYVFNMEYPTSIAVTLEFFQRCILEINPLYGSKTNRKSKRVYQGTHPKIIKFVNKYKLFSSWLL